MNEPVAIAVLAKAPLPGFAKTRLIPALGADGAASLQARLVARAVATACAAVIGPVTLWATPDESDPLFRAMDALFGVGLAHFLWWAIVGKLPTVTASLGALLVPVVGVVTSTLLLGERPTLNDIVGFALIFCAAASVLLQRDGRRPEPRA